MSITRESVWAAQPTTSRGVAVHLSYDKKSDRIVYASNRSVFIRSVSNPQESFQYTNHVHPVTVAKFAPSGFYIASADEAGNVKVWDCVGEDMVTKGEYHVISGRVNDLAWDADSQRIIAVGDGKERFGHCFTADSGNSVGEISGHTEIINSVAIRPVRPYRAATVADDSNLVFYHGPPFKFNFTSRGNHSNFVHDVQFSPNGEYIVSVGADKKIILYDGKSGDLLKDAVENSGHEGGIFAVSWSSDSKSFATASADGSVRLFSVESGSVKFSKAWKLPKALENQQVGVVFAGDDRVVSLTYSGDLYYWNLTQEDKPERVVYGHQKAINAITSVASGLYTGAADGRVCNWENNTSSAPGAQIVSGEGHSGQVVSISGNTSDRSAWSAAWDDKLKQIENGEFIKTSSINGQPVDIDSCQEGSLVAVATESELALYKNGDQQKIVSLNFTASCVSLTDKYVAVGDTVSTVHLFNASDLSSAGDLPALRAAPCYLAFSPNGKYLAVGDKTGKIPLYDVGDKSVVTSRWTFHTSRVTSINWHESSDYIVSGSVDTNIYVYSVENPAKNIKTMGAHKDGVNAVVWGGKNKVFSAGADGAVKQWTIEFHK